MRALIKPQRLCAGDTVATVSLSSGLAGDENMRFRYEQGKARLQDVFGLKVVEMPHTLAGTDYTYAHPEKRAEDMMAAFRDPSIKGIFCNIGGEESIRMLPYIDFDVIRCNPKVFCGYSDSTISHMMCLKAGLGSFYGPCVIVDFAENVAIPEYTTQWVKKVLFSPEAAGNVPTSPTTTGQFLEWDISNRHIPRTFEANPGYELLQGEGTVQGRLIGGCLESLETLKGLSLFPSLEDFEGSILFLETCELTPPAWFITDALRSYAMMGVLERVNGILVGRPQGGALYKEYKESYTTVLKEFGLQNLPVLMGASFGHNEPKFCVPYGVLGEINCEAPGFALLEGAVL